MARVTCRCGEELEIHGVGPERIECPRCGARIRLHRHGRRVAGIPEAADGYIRFHCPCGRRLKVRAENPPEAGRCPDCGLIVPVPDSALPSAPPGRAAGAGAVRGDPNARTDELDEQDRATLEEWSARHLGQSGPSRAGADDNATPAVIQAVRDREAAATPPGTVPPSMVKFEAGLRVCPRCGKPVHLSATTCRECGSPVPRR
jgi:hypothetical protein